MHSLFLSRGKGIKKGVKTRERDNFITRVKCFMRNLWLVMKKQDNDKRS